MTPRPGRQCYRGYFCRLCTDDFFPSWTQCCGIFQFVKFFPWKSLLRPLKSHSPAVDVTIVTIGLLGLVSVTLWPREAGYAAGGRCISELVGLHVHVGCERSQHAVEI